jgi:hypothetical protein
MQNSTQFIPGFHLHSLRRKPRSAAQKLASEIKFAQRHSLAHLSDSFRGFLPPGVFKQNDKGDFSRRRLFSKENTFWAFFSQILDADGGCREVIRKIQAYRTTRELPLPSGSTAAYCQARKKLDSKALGEIAAHTGKVLQARGMNHTWKNHKVIIVDGTGVSMPDTADNQAQWPQPSTQAVGCGFPQAHICACFCLHTGAMVSHRIGHQKDSELTLFRQQMETFESGAILLGDKQFCSFYDVWELQNRGVDAVFPRAIRKRVEVGDAVNVLGRDDLLIVWPKPKWNPRLSYSREVWEALPDTLTLRQIKVTIDEPGFRKQSFDLISTLTDPLTYSALELADLYRQRWDVELSFGDIKTTMGMDVLRCQTPEMVNKEISMHWIVYNCIRLLMFEAAIESNNKVRRMSFKASMQALRQWEPALSRLALTDKERQGLITRLRTAIGRTVLPDRPHRSEPRCKKRRPKNYALLTRPRHEMVEIPHRSRYRAEAP